MSDHERLQTKGLRMEAQAVEMSRLSGSQLRAAAEIVEKLQSAYHQKQPKRARDQRRNQILMISGDKGSRKTTLALSVRRWYDMKDMKSEWPKQASGTRTARTKILRRNRTANIKGYRRLPKNHLA